MSAPRPINFECIAGDSIQLRFVVRDQDQVITDISGYTINFAARREGASAPIFETPSTVESLITNAVGGEFLITVPSLQTVGKIGEYAWQCEVESPLGLVQTVGRGKLMFLESVAGQ